MSKTKAIFRAKDTYQRFSKDIFSTNIGRFVLDKRYITRKDKCLVRREKDGFER